MPETTLKPGWTKVKFGEVVRLCTDRSSNPEADGIERYVGLEHLEPEDLRIRRWGLVAEGTTFTSRFKPGQVLFGKRRAYQRKVAVADFEGVCSGDIYVFESADPKHLLPELVPFVCQTERFFEYAIGTSAGSLSPRTNWKQLKDFEIFIPPVTEQEKISKVLFSLTASLEKNQEFQATSNTAAQSFADSVFDLNPVKKFLRWEASIEDLQLVKLGDLCSVQVGYPFKSSDYSKSGDRLLRCSNVGIGDLEWLPNETKFWPSEKRDEFSDYVLSEGDIVVAMDRPFVSDGFKVSIVRSIDLPALLLQRVGRFQLNEEIDKNFLWCFLHSTSLYLQLLAHQQGTDLPHISKFDIERTVIPDIPLEEQQELGNKYLNLSSTSRKIDNRISIIQKMKTKLLKEALG